VVAVTTVAAVHSLAGLRLLAQVQSSGEILGGESLVVVIWNDQIIPEVGEGLSQRAAAAGFSEVIDLNDKLAPFHPSQWEPADVELIAWREMLRSHLPAVTELILEDLDHPTCRMLAKVFTSADLRGLDAGLGAYGPPAMRRSHAFEQRIISQWQADLIPGLRPVNPTLSTAFPLTIAPPLDPGPVLVLGSDLVGRGLADQRRDLALHNRLIAKAATLGAEVVFCPDPATTPGQLWLIQRAAQECGIEIELADSDSRLLFEQRRPHTVVGTVSPDLVWAHGLGVCVEALGVRELLRNLVPFHHPARVELTLLDALLRPEPGRYDLRQAQELLCAVAYVMRPEALPEAHERTAGFLAGLAEAEQQRYFSRGRLESLGFVRRRTLAARSLRWLGRRLGRSGGSGGSRL
jgi:hypothetical protein